MNDNLQELYNNLRSLGYTSDELGNEENFRQSMSDKDKRENLYDYIKGNGHAGDWSYEEYEAKYGGGQAKQAQTQPQPQETTQSAQTQKTQPQQQAQEKPVEKPQQPTAPNEVSPKGNKDNKGFWQGVIEDVANAFTKSKKEEEKAGIEDKSDVYRKLGWEDRWKKGDFSGEEEQVLEEQRRINPEASDYTDAEILRAYYNNKHKGRTKDELYNATKGTTEDAERYEAWKNGDKKLRDDWAAGRYSPSEKEAIDAYRKEQGIFGKTATNKQILDDYYAKKKEEEEKANYDAIPTGVSANDWGQFTDNWNNFVEESARFNEDVAKAKGKKEEKKGDILHPNWDELGNKEGFFDKDTWALRNEERTKEDELWKQREQYIQQMRKGQEVWKKEAYARQMMSNDKLEWGQERFDEPIEIEQDGKKVLLTSGGFTTSPENYAVAQLATTKYNDDVAKLEAQTKETKGQVEDLQDRLNEIAPNIEADRRHLLVTPSYAHDYEKKQLPYDISVVEATQRKVNQIQKFIRIAEKYRDDDIGFLHAFGYGVQDAITDAGTWDFGFMDLTTAAAACEILKKTERGEKLKPEEEALLDAYALEYAARMEYAQYIGRGYGAGAQAVDFAVLAAQLAINPLRGAGAGAEKAFANWLEKKGINYAERSLAGYTTRLATRAVTNAFPAAGLTILQAPEIIGAGIEGTMDFQTNGGEALPEQVDTGAGVYYNNEGRRTQIKGGIAKNDKSMAQSIAQSYKSQLFSDWAMMMVPAVGEVTGVAGKGIANATEKVTPKFVADYVSKVGTYEAARGFGSFLNAVDIPKRSFDFYATMQLGNILDAWTPGGQEFHNEEGTGVFDFDRQVDEYVNAVMFETVMGAGRGVSFGWNRYQLGRQFDAQYQNMEAGTWRNKQAQLAELTKKFESGDEQQTADAIKSLFADQSLTKEQIEDAVKLGGLCAQRHFCDRMFNDTYADLRANDNATGRRIQQGLTNSFNEGLGIVNPNLRFDEDGNVTEVTGDEAAPVTRNSAAAQEAWGKYNIHRQRILDMCGKDVLAQLDENPQGTLRTMRNTGVDAVTLQACEEYVNASMKVMGINAAIGGEATLSTTNATQAIRMRQQKDGKLHHATLEDGRKVDILGETGTSATVIDEDGNTSMVPMSEIASIDGTESADALIGQAKQRINEQAQATMQQLLKPLLQFQPGDTYNIELPNGNRGNVVVIGEMNDKGEVAKAGNVFVMMPDSSVEELSMDYVQQQWDMARSEDWANEIDERRRRQIEQENGGEIPDQWKPKDNEPNKPTEPENPTTEEPAEAEGEAGGTEGGETTTEAEGGTETPAEQPEQRTYGIGDKVQIVDDEGNIIDAEVTQVHPDGTLIVEYEGGQKPYTQETLNEAEAEAKEAQQPAETQAETPTETSTQQPATEATPTTETPATGGTEQPTEQPQQQSALEQIPKTSDGKLDWQKAPSLKIAVDGMIEMAGDRDKAKKIAGQLHKKAQKALKEITKKAKKATEESDADSFEGLLDAENAANAEVEKAQKDVDFYQSVLDEITRREEAEKQAVIDQLNAEQAQLAQSQELKDVPDYTNDNGADARARGFRNVNGQKVVRQSAEQFQHQAGNDVTIQFSLGEARKGHIALVEADKVQASHRNDGTANPLHFISGAQPKLWSDVRRNDIMARILELPNSKGEVVPLDMKQLAGPITAYVGSPSVNARGEVIQGNGRTVLINEMYRGSDPKYKEQAEKYRQFLRDHAAEWGLTPEQVDAMEKPMLVNVLDVTDEDAEKLGKYTSKHMETGGVERMNPATTIGKLGENKMPGFISRLMKGADEGGMSLSDALNTKENVDAALKYLLDEGAISQTEYDSAYHPNGEVTKDAKEDLKRMLQECILQGANENLRSEFEKLPTKAQNALLATSWRNMQGDPKNSIIPDIQEAIHLYNVLLENKAFAKATGKKAVRDAVKLWQMQLEPNLTTGELEQPSKKFSNFAVELATRFKTEKQSELAAQLTEVYDLIQPSAQGELFTDRGSMTVEEAIKKVFDVDYGKKRGTTLDSDHPTGEGGEQGESGNATGGEPSPQGAGNANGAGGAQGNAEATVTEPPHTRTATQERKAKERRQSVEGEVKKMTDALGTTVRILDSIDQVRDPKIRKAIEAGEKTGEKITGWYDPVTGEVVVYYPNLTDVNEAKLTYLHEVVGHKGLRALFGDKFEDTMKDVYRSLPKKLQESIQKRMDSDTFKAQGYADPLVASVEEELSNWAEKNKKPSWWDRVVANVRDMIRSVVDLEMTDADIDYLLWRSRNNLENQTLKQRATDKVLEQRARKANAEARDNQAKAHFRTREEKQQAHDRAQQISDEAEKRIETGWRDEAQTKANDLAKGFGIDGVTLPENADLDNTEGMVVREAARQGKLKDALGKDWDDFLKKVYQNTDEETLKDINEYARQNGWNFADATERYLASLSDNGAFEQAVERGMWDGVKSAFDEMLRSKGIEDGIPDNDARYALWRNEQNKTESPNSTLLARATEVATDNALSNENSPMFRIRQDDPNDPKVLYRNGVNEPAEVARTMEFILSHQTGLRGLDWLKHGFKRNWFQMAEAWQDSMQALYKFMQACEGSNWKGEAEVADWMNPYTRENRLSSKNEDDINVFARKFLAPMFDEAKKLAHNDRERRLLNNYIISKHGLERNEYMAEREARNAWEEQRAKAVKKQSSEAPEEWENKQYKVGDTVKTYGNEEEGEGLYEWKIVSQNEDGTFNLERDGWTWSDATEGGLNAYEREVRDKEIEEWRNANRSSLAWDELTDEEREQLTTPFRRDFAGLTGLFGLKGEEWQQAEAEARELVENYETAHDTERLWKTINATSESILKKQLDTGLISKETYDRIKGMYKYYVPLRGFEEKTTDDVYAYLNHQRGEFNSPIRRAEGRTSLANDPFESLASMAQSGIIYGNRNELVKQAFYNFVKQHPSDYVTESPLWLKFKPEDGEWEAVFCDTLRDGDSPDVVSQKLAEFEERMKQAQEEHPDMYATGKQAYSLPYKMPDKSSISEHQVVVRIGGRDKVLTVNGNPRLAQAINGKTNPDVPVKGWQGALNDTMGKATRFLSQVHTTWNPDFIISNYLRDVGYSNVMAWIKESGVAPEYAGRFTANTVRCNPGTMLTLLDQRRRGTLNTKSGLGKLFEDFMSNGGETGYARMQDRDKIAKEIKKKLHVGVGGTVSDAVDVIGEIAGELGRSVELSQRFAAFVTSREMGRDIGRSIYDAKEITVNFNKKGAGSTFYGANGQTVAGNIVSLISGAGRDLFMFWNAGVQGTTNIARNTFRSKQSMAKAATAWGTLMLLGYMNSMYGGGDEDKEKKSIEEHGDSYWDLPTYTRRTNFCFRGKGGWTTIPISIELRLPYGLGEIMGSYARGHEKNKDLLWDAGDLLGHIAFPVNFLEGQEAGSHNWWLPFMPSPLRPGIEVGINRSWSGRNIHSPEMPWNERKPAYTRAYRNTDNVYIGISRGLNNMTGGDDIRKGWINLPPEDIQYVAQQMIPFYTTANQVMGIYRDVTGQKDFSWRDVPIANRIKKDSGEQSHQQAVSREYWENKKEVDALIQDYKDRNDSKEHKAEAKEIRKTDRYKAAKKFQDKEKDIREKLKDADDPKKSDEKRERARKKATELQEKANDLIRKR